MQLSKQTVLSGYLSGVILAAISKLTMPKKGKKAAAEAPKRPRRTPDNPFQASDNSIEYVPLRVIAMRIQAILHGTSKGKRAEHYHVIWEGFPEEKDFTWEPLENLHGHEELVSDYELWLKEENKRVSL